MSKVWDNDRHVLTVWATDDPDYPYEIEVEHPQECRVVKGCASNCHILDLGLSPDQLNERGKWHVHIYYDCPIAHEVDAIGPDEAMFATPMRSTKFQQGLVDCPPEHGGDLWVEAKRQLDEGAELARVPFKAHWGGSTDYWGEWDYEFEFTLHMPENAA